MSGWWLTDLWSSLHGQVLVVSWLVWVIVSIALHELAHGWTAIKLGDDTPIRTGHMTWNPMVHMGPFSFAALLLMGIAWGAMPVDPSRLRGKHADTLVTAAGPLMNLALALVVLLVLVFWEPFAGGYLFSGVTVQDPLKTNLLIFLITGAKLNCVLMLFNLLPVPPLDGGRILMNLVPSYDRLMRSEHGQFIGLGIFILFFVFFAGPLFVISDAVVVVITDFVHAVLFPSMGS